MFSNDMLIFTLYSESKQWRHRTHISNQPKMTSVLRMGGKAKGVDGVEKVYSKPRAIPSTFHMMQVSRCRKRRSSPVGRINVAFNTAADIHIELSLKHLASQRNQELSGGGCRASPASSRI